MSTSPIDLTKLPREHAKAIKSTGFDVEHPFPPPKLTILPSDTASQLTGDAILKTDPFVPAGSNPTFLPGKSTVTGVKSQKQGTIFDRDDRYQFVPQGYPWRIIGKVRTAGGFGSGTMIGPQHVLTASHCAGWNADGTLGWITFTPGYYDGNGPQGVFPVTEVISWEKVGHFATDLQVAFDYAVLVLGTPIGNTTGWAGTRVFDKAWLNKPTFQYLGYPGELARGERPYIQSNCVINTKEDKTLNGRHGADLGNFNDFTPGDSGGPAWGFWAGETGPFVVGVGSIIGSTAVQRPGGTDTDNDYGGGQALVDIVSWARTNRP